MARRGVQVKMHKIQDFFLRVSKVAIFAHVEKNMLNLSTICTKGLEDNSCNRQPTIIKGKFV